MNNETQTTKPPLTLAEFLNKDVDGVIKEVTVEPDIDYKAIKKALKGHFSDFPHHIKTGHKFELGDYSLEICRVIKATDRIFLALQHNDKEFSVSTSYLTGTEKQFPYQLGNLVNFPKNEKDLVWKIVGIIKSSNKVKIEKDGFFKILPISKVSLVGPMES